MAPKSQKKQKYIVTRPGLDNCSVGDEIELTQAQADARINKVVPVDEYEAPKDPAPADKADDKAVAKLEAKVETLTQERDDALAAAKTAEADKEMAETKIVSLEAELEEAKKPAPKKATKPKAAGDK